MIALAFEALCRASADQPQRVLQLTRILGRAVGGPQGIVAGQAWECEREIDLSEYHRAKTGALFAAAAMAGAAATGADFNSWSLLGFRLGEAFQVADDVRDVIADTAELGKPAGQDRALGRPSSVTRYGLQGAVKQLNQLVAEALEVVPECAGRAGIRTLILEEVSRLLPRKFVRLAA
jgi:geranylgeranyl diphosphate synthase type II